MKFPKLNAYLLLLIAILIGEIKRHPESNCFPYCHPAACPVNGTLVVLFEHNKK